MNILNLHELIWLRRRVRICIWRIIVSSKPAHLFMLSLFIKCEKDGIKLLVQLLSNSTDPVYLEQIKTRLAQDEKHLDVFRTISSSIGDYHEIPESIYVQQYEIFFMKSSLSLIDFLAISILTEEEDIESLKAYTRALADTILQEQKGMLLEIIQDEINHIAKSYKLLCVLVKDSEIKELFATHRAALRSMRRAVFPNIMYKLYLLTNSKLIYIYSWILKIVPKLA